MTAYPQLVIEYVLEGQQRGYNFTSPTRGYSEDALKAIWRNAMPRGQGWGAFTGAASVKCFTLPDKRIAVAQVAVTDQQDESGRRGIRRAVIDVLAHADYAEALKTRLALIPASIQQDADHNLENWRRTRVLERLSGKIRKVGQLILTHAYSTPYDWQVVEAVLLKLAITPHPALRPLASPLNFTTLALEYREEAPVVALPAAEATNIRNIPTLPVV